MEQTKRRLFLIERLLAESPRYRDIPIPAEAAAQKTLLRSLMNVRPPRPVSESFLAVQDEYLREETARKGVTELSDLTPVREGIYLWRGDITTLRCDAIVNAANSGMTGCYRPCHNCIDNCIHTYAGVQLRLYCAQMMEEQGHEEPTGQAKITPGIIKYPFWRMTAAEPLATYACINYGEAVCPPRIAPRSICIDGDIASVLDKLI